MSFCLQLYPVFTSLRRHRLNASLLIIVIALSSAVISNCVFLMMQRGQRLSMPAGYDEHAIVEIQLDSLPPGPDGGSRLAADLAALRQLPGVEAASFSNMLPMDWYASRGSYMATSAEQQAARSGPFAALYGGEDLPRTLGVRLLAGRWLDPQHYLEGSMASSAEQPIHPAEALITAALARRLWGGGSALGHPLYYMQGHPPAIVVGIIEHLPQAVISGDADDDYSVILPVRLAPGHGIYLLRTQPRQRARVLRAAIDALLRIDPNRVTIRQQFASQARRIQFGKDIDLIVMLAGLCLMLLLVTAAGMVGLTSYWVGQRRRQIGIRRALGASRAAILGYFVIENLLVSLLGVLLGAGLAYAMGYALMQAYELPRLPPGYIPVGALALLLTGQVAALAPALRAASLPPALASGHG